jgi:hypothetical protein
MAYRIPDSNINLSGSYQQGKGNIQISCVPDESLPLLGPNGKRTMWLLASLCCCVQECGLAFAMVSIFDRSPAEVMARINLCTQGCLIADVFSDLH